jgi:hypothetical protein
VWCRAVLQLRALRRASADRFLLVVPVLPHQVARALNWVCWAREVGLRHWLLLATDAATVRYLSAFAGDPSAVASFPLPSVEASGTAAREGNGTVLDEDLSTWEDPAVERAATRFLQVCASCC